MPVDRIDLDDRDCGHQVPTAWNWPVRWQCFRCDTWFLTLGPVPRCSACGFQESATWTERAALSDEAVGRRADDFDPHLPSFPGS
jgi:hypothetical protein